MQSDQTKPNVPYDLKYRIKTEIRRIPTNKLLNFKQELYFVKSLLRWTFNKLVTTSFPFIVHDLYIYKNYFHFKNAGDLTARTRMKTQKKNYNKKNRMKNSNWRVSIFCRIIDRFKNTKDPIRSWLNLLGIPNIIEHFKFCVIAEFL